MSNRNPDAAATIARLAWVSDGMDELETQGAQALVDLALRHELVFDGMIRKSWVADGMTAAEASIVGDLKPIADKRATAAAEIATMPFLDTIEPYDVVARPIGPTIRLQARESHYR